MLQPSSTIETRESWIVASVALFVMMMTFGFRSDPKRSLVRAGTTGWEALPPRRLTR
jgi:hypothetical protein